MVICDRCEKPFHALTRVVCAKGCEHAQCVVCAARTTKERLKAEAAEDERRMF